MGSKSENSAHQAPEVINQDYPEAVVPQQQHFVQQHQQQQFNQQQQQQPQYQQYQQYQQYPLKPEDGQYPPGSAPYSAYGGSQLDPTSPRPLNAPVGGHAPADGAKKKGRICGCTVLVFVLCVIIGLLSAAVIGLAAGTGVEASRAKTADARAAQLASELASASATATGGAPAATSTSFAQLDRNCSADPNAVTGTTYDAFSRKPPSESYTTCISVPSLTNINQIFSTGKLVVHDPVQQGRKGRPVDGALLLQL
jgi:hypothetical protein